MREQEAQEREKALRLNQAVNEEFGGVGAEQSSYNQGLKDMMMEKLQNSKLSEQQKEELLEEMTGKLDRIGGYLRHEENSQNKLLEERLRKRKQKKEQLKKAMQKQQERKINKEQEYEEELKDAQSRKEADKKAMEKELEKERKEEAKRIEDEIAKKRNEKKAGFEKQLEKAKKGDLEEAMHEFTTAMKGVEQELN